MTAAPETRDPASGRGARPFERRLPADAGLLLLGIIVTGLLLRAFIAGIWLPRSGFGTDVGDFTAWAQRLAQLGPSAFYVPNVFTDYPPGYMYVLWALGSIGQALKPVLGQDITSGLVKIPPILADGGVAWLLFLTARRFLGERIGDAASQRIGLVAATVYLFNPGVLFDSSVWGQVDSVGMLAVMGSVYLLARGWTEAAAVTSVVALLLKFQFGFMIPIVALVGLKRHLFGRSSDPEQDGRPDLLRVLTSLASGLGSLVVLIWPFGLSVWSPGDAPSLVGKFLEAANTYKGVTINAFNLWMNPFTALARPRDAGGLAPSLGWGDDQPAAFLIGSFGITWQLIGEGLFVAVALVAAYALIRRDDAVGILAGTLLVAVAFFVLPTRVHERYLFPALVLGALLVLRHPRWAVLYGLLSLCFFANIYGVYTADWSFAGSVLNPGMGGAAMARDPVLNATLLSEWGIYLVSLLSVALLGWVLVLVVRLARQASPAWAAWRADDLETDDGALAAGGWSPELAGGPDRAEDRRVVVAGLRLPHWLRVDRAHPMYRDPPRRLDRLDLVLVIGFVLLAFVYRDWRSDVPRSMCCFDEIYHARSAIEFLSDWEHGWTRDVYEWTHPMVAKYLIAAGIELANPNQVVTTTTLDAPATAVTVAPRRAAFGQQRSVAFVGEGSRVDALDALSGERLASWQVTGAVASLAYDDADRRLLVGNAAGGTVAIYDLSGFLATQGPRSPPTQTATITTGLASVEQIIANPSASALVFRGSDGIATADRDTGAILATAPIVTPSVALALSNGSDGDALYAVEPARRTLLSLDPATLKERSSGQVTVDAAPLGPLLVQGSGTDQQLWVAVGDLPATDEHPAVSAGLAVYQAPALIPIATVPLPGRASVLGWQPQANLVFAGGSDAAGTPTIWTINPLGDSRSGFSTFDSTALPGAATGLAFDVSDHSQADDDGRLLATTAGSGAALVGIDTTSDPAAWRLMGIVFGAILVGLIYLMAATMFRRRWIAILAAAFVTFDGMSYAMSRIAMNDIYVAVFIVAAYLVFWLIWSGRWARSAWWALPLAGVLIGLAAATKWVGWYALVGLWILVLARSALGRFLLVAGIGFVTIVGGIGLGGTAVPWPFLAVCLLALAFALVLVFVRPVRLEVPDLMALPATGVVLGGVGIAFAIGYNQVEGRTPKGAVEVLFDVLARGAQAAWPAWIMLGVAGGLIGVRAVISLRDGESDRRWLQPREMAGFEWPWIAACLLVVPLLVYFLTYIPYLNLGHHISIPGGPGYGWSLDELQVQMFAYHFGLTPGHPAASPWWSWPLDIKPVWFYGSPTWDGRLVAAVYNNGNPILFWAGVPAILLCTLLAWRRRSLALVLIVAAFTFQFLPWTRIERATFQYHYLTAVLFAMIAVAYVVDEALHRRDLQAIGVAFLAAAVIVGIAVWPLGAAWPMPDWYINMAHALPPWNFYFQFPNPPQGPRAELVPSNPLQLAVGVAVGLLAAAFALYGRDLFEGREVRLLAGSHGTVEQEQPQGDDEQRPQVGQVQEPEVVPRQEPDADEDQ